MTKHLPCLLSLLVLPGCPLLEVEVDVPEACVTYRDLRVPGVAAEGAVASTFEVDDLAAIQQLAELDASLAFVRGEARITSGADSFAFVQGARLSLASGDPESTLPTLSLYACEGDCDTSGATLGLTGGPGNSVVDYVRTGRLVVGIDLAGAVPSQDWSMDVDVCFTGRAKHTVDP